MAMLPLPIGSLSRCLSALALAIAVLGFTGCDSADSRADLVFINGVEPETLDPAQITGQAEGRLANALFEGLMRYNAQGLPEPGVAESYVLSEDGKTYTFHLRDSARWSNGDPVTAHDFVKAWRRTLEPETASQYAYQLHYIRNARPFNEGQLDDFSAVGIQALDDRTLKVELESPTPFFLSLCAFTTLLPVHTPTVEQHPGDWIKPEYLVGNGAFTLESWRLNDKIRLQKNNYYWDAANVALETIDVLPITNANVALNFYLSDEADLIMDKSLIPVTLVDELLGRPDFHVAPFLGNYFLRFNVTEPPFDDVRVRQAIGMAIDRELITQRVTGLGEQPADSLTPPGAGGYEPPPGPRYDPDQARQLLAEAGYPNGDGFPLVSYLFSEGDIDENIVVEIKQMLKAELNIEITLHKQEWKVYLGSLSKIDYDIGRSSWVGDYNDPNTFLDMFVTGGGNNRTGWSNEEYDALIAEAARTLDDTKRHELFRRAETILVSEEAPIAPLYYYVGVQIYDPQELGGIEPNVLDEHPLRAIYRK